MTRRWHVRAALAATVAAVGLLAAAIGLLASRPTPAPASLPDSPRDETMLWTAGMEEGSLAEWDLGDDGGEFNSGIADADASQDVAHDGDWSAKLSMTAPPESGTRLFRWGEPRDHRDLYYEAWFYIPADYQLTGDADTGRYWNVFQFKSVSEDGSANDPFWFLTMSNRPDGEMVPELVWWHTELEGPRSDESGYQTFAADDEATFPVDRWFEIRARVRQSKDFDGIVQFWVDGEQIFDMRDVRTGYANCQYNDWCVEQHWSVNLYSDGLTPSPSVVYVDAVQIRRVEE